MGGNEVSFLGQGVKWVVDDKHTVSHAQHPEKRAISNHFGMYGCGLIEWGEKRDPSTCSGPNATRAYVAGAAQRKDR